MIGKIAALVGTLTIATTAVLGVAYQTGSSVADNKGPYLAPVVVLADNKDPYTTPVVLGDNKDPYAPPTNPTPSPTATP